MSHYANYMKELRGNIVVEDECGFYQYSLKPKYLYIEDFYIDPQYRGFKEAKRYIREMAKVAIDNDYTYLMGAVNLRNYNAASILNLYLRNKCKLYSAHDNYIYITINVKDAKALEA